ncbi:MAG: ABC transporter substrate-binding protein [Haloarculaceae archaeon]
MRVVSLLPSATEIVCALGVEPVGVSHECDHPPAVESLPAVNRSRIDADADSGRINEQVAAAQEAGGVYEIDRELLADLAPDLIVTQGVCDVCAVDHVAVERAVADLGLDSEVLTLDVHSLADLYESVLAVGRALDRESRAGTLVADMQRRVQRVRHRAATTGEGPRVAVLDWTDPVMVAGHWVPEMVELAGGEYGLERAGGESRPREWAEVRAYDPELLAVAPCGFDIEQTRANLTDLTERPGWRDLTAVRNGRAYIVDGHHYVNRSGPRLVDTLEYLAALIGPDRFDEPPEGVVQPIASSVDTTTDHPTVD